MLTKMTSPEYLSAHIRSDPYLRERLSPEPGDFTYLHLADLRLAMENVRTSSAICMLDYGCGGSPYRALFPNADYRRADHLQKEGDQLNYVLDQTSRVHESNNTFDLILSTQVLEHVDDPVEYIRECYRLLKSGGELYITTHGSYPDHGCPHDYFRWTADGLARSLTSAGFEVCRVEKQTTGPRALFFQCDCQYVGLRIPNRNLFALLLNGFRLCYKKIQPWVHKMCDRHFSGNRVVTENLEAHTTYVVAACLARKP